MKNLTPLLSSPRGGALSARQVALWAGWPFQPSDWVPESRAYATDTTSAAVSTWGACAGTSGPGGPVRRNLRLGARHGGSGRDTCVPGGAETAAERAADPGVRPGVGVWVPRLSAWLAFLLPEESPPPSDGQIFEFLLSSCLERF